MVRGDVKCEMRSAKCEVQNPKCKVGVRLQLRVRMWMRCLPVLVSHLPYIFFPLLSNLCLISSARRTPSLSSAMSEWQPSSASSETRPAMSKWQLGLALASFSSLPDYPSVKLTSDALDKVKGTLGSMDSKIERVLQALTGINPAASQGPPTGGVGGGIS